MRQLPFETLCQAVTCGEFSRAQQLWQECVGGLAEELNNQTLTEARLAEVRSLLEWARIVVLCERAHLMGQINSLHVAREYEFPVPPRVPCIAEASF